MGGLTLREVVGDGRVEEWMGLRKNRNFYGSKIIEKIINANVRF